MSGEDTIFGCLDGSSLGHVRGGAIVRITTPLTIRVRVTNGLMVDLSSNPKVN